MKKKRLLAVLLAAVIALSACGNNSGSSSDDDDDKPKKTRAAEDEDSKEGNNKNDAKGGMDVNDILSAIGGDKTGGENAFPSAESADITEYDEGYEGYIEEPDYTTAPYDEEFPETTTTEPVDPDAPIVIKNEFSYYLNKTNDNYAEFKDGKLLFTGSKAFNVVDIEGNVVTEVSGFEESYSYYRLLDNGSVLAYNKYEGRYTNAFGDKVAVYNSSGDLVISPEINGFDKCLATTDNYMLVLKTDSSFDGDTYYMGTLDYDGKWVRELTKVTADIDFKNLEVNLVYENMDDDYIIIAKNNKGMIVIDINKGTTVFDSDDSYYDDVDYYSWSLDESYLTCISKAKYDLKTGDRKSADSFYTYDYMNINGILKDNIYYGYYYNDDYVYHYCLFDDNYKVITDLDGYNILNIFYSNGNAVLISKGASSGVYLCVIDKDGKRAFDPVKLSDNDYMYFDFVRVFDDCIVYQPDGEDYFCVSDFKGEQKKVEIEGDLVAYDDATGTYVTYYSSKYSFFDSTGKNTVIVKN